MPELVLLLLGSPSIECDGVPISVDTRKAIALMAYLAVTRQTQRRDSLAALLWPDYDDSHARATLRRTLSVLVKALDGGYLAVERETIGLVSSAGLKLDVDEFHRHLTDCRTHGHPANEACAACVEPLSAATALYRDDFMAGFSLRDSPAFDDWQLFQRDALRRELASALERLTRAHIVLGHYDSAITTARRWLALDRLHEPTHRYLMRLYAWSGQRAAAVRQYHECVQVLEKELGVAPLDATTRLYEAIKENRAPPPPARTSSTNDRSQTLARTLDVETSTARAGTSPSRAPLAPRGVYPLVGRSVEWATLLSTYEAIRGDGQIVVLEGEAGIGKTRLAEEFAAHARAQGALVVVTRCYDGEASLAYAPLVAALRATLMDKERAHRLNDVPAQWVSEAARLVPDLERMRSDLPPAPPLDGPGAQSHFFEGLRRVLLAACRGASQGTKPGILLFDDIQWADSASLDVLTYLARRLRDQPICLLLTWRSSDVPSRPQVRRLIAEAQRDGRATIITLSRLSEGAVQELLRTTSGAQVAPESAKRLYEETEGVPFFLVEYLLALSKGSVAAEAQGWPVLGGIRELLRARLGAIGDTSMQVLTAAAVVGRWFDFETVREVSGRSEEETVGALEDLLARGLIRELGGTAASVPTYDFSHEKLRSLVYEEMSLARRRLLHRRVAESLAAALRRGRDSSGMLGQIAHHYLLAGDQAAAADYYKQAGERAKRLYANREALAHLRTALALGSPAVAELHEAIGDLLTILGEYALALESYGEVAALTGPESAARLEHKRGNVYERRGEWAQAEHHFEAALSVLDRLEVSGSRGERAHIFADWSLAEHHLGQLDQAWRLAQQARELAEDAADTEERRALAQAHNILGVLASSRGDVDDAIAHLEHSLTLAEEADDTSARAAALNNLALALAARGDVEQAMAHTKTALALSVVQGDRHREAALHNNLADLLHVAGRPEDAMTHLKQAVSIYAEIGVEAGAVQSGIWKLTAW